MIRDYNLWVQFKEQDDRKAREQLILNNLNLVGGTLTRMWHTLPPHPGMEWDDLYSHATIALLTAIDRFDPQRGFQFNTYAIWVIRGAILNSIRENSHLPPKLFNDRPRILHAFEHLTAELGRSPTADEVAEHTGLAPALVARALDRAAQPIESLHTPLPGRQDDEGTVGDMLADPRPPVLELLLAEAELDAVAEAIQHLPFRQRQALEMLYTGERAGRLGRVAEAMGSYQNGISARNRALARLRKALGVEDP